MAASASKASWEGEGSSKQHNSYTRHTYVATTQAPQEVMASTTASEYGQPQEDTPH